MLGSGERPPRGVSGGHLLCRPEVSSTKAGEEPHGESHLEKPDPSRGKSDTLSVKITSLDFLSASWARERK